MKLTALILYFAYLSVIGIVPEVHGTGHVIVTPGYHSLLLIDNIILNINY